MKVNGLMMKSIYFFNFLKYFFSATFLSKNCQESCEFICNYVIECDKQLIDISTNLNLFFILSQYFYAFLEIGGDQILEKNLLGKVSPLFKKISGLFCNFINVFIFLNYFRNG
jgi:hypothetical protein